MKRTLTTITAALALLLTLSLTLAACGGGDGDEPSERRTTERSTRTGPSETPTTEPEAETAIPTQTATKAETPAPTAEALRERTPRPEATESAASGNDGGTKEAEQATADEQPTASPTDVPPTEEPRGKGLEWPWIDERITFETPHWETPTQKEYLEHLEDTLIAVTSHTYGIFMGPEQKYGNDCNPAWTMTNIARSLAMVSPTGELRHLNMAQEPTGIDREGRQRTPWQDRTLADDITWESSNEEVLTWINDDWYDAYGWWPTCHQFGETTITATHVNGSTASVKLEVTKAGFSSVDARGGVSLSYKMCDKEKPVEERGQDELLVKLEPWPWALAAEQRVKLIAASTGTRYNGPIPVRFDWPETNREMQDWVRDTDKHSYRIFITSSCLQGREFEAVREEFKRHPLVKEAWTRQELLDQNRP